MKPLARRERGATMVLASLSLVTLITFTALAVDIGVGAARTRDLQQVADLVALDVSRLFDGRMETDPTLQADVQAQVLESVAANDFPLSATTYDRYASGTRTLELTLGCFISATRTFVDVCPTNAATNALLPPNAVRIAAADHVDYKFADVIGFGGDDFDRDAVATLDPISDVNVGSVAVGLQQSLGPTSATANVAVQVLNGVLGAAFGAGATATPPPNFVGLDVLSYRGLAAADVTLGEIAAALGFATVDEMANTDITAGELVEAAAVLMESPPRSDNVAAAGLRAMAASAGFNANSVMRLGGGPLVIEQGTEEAAASARTNLLGFVTSAAQVVNGRNLLSFSFNPQVGGLTVDVRMAIIESAQHAIGHAGHTTARTAQVRFALTVNIPASGLIPAIRLPLVVEGATADASLNRVTCREPLQQSESEIGVVTSLARTRLGVVSDGQLQTPGAISPSVGVIVNGGLVNLNALVSFGLPGLLTLLGANISGSGEASLGGGTDTLVFQPLNTPNPPQRAMGGITAVDLSAQLAATFRAAAGGFLGLVIPTTLDSAFDNLGGGILDPLLHAAGISIGGADVWSTMIECRQPMLVE